MMTNIAEKRFIEWLRDAHAMEEQAEQIFSAQAERIEDYTDIKLQYERQAALAKLHAELLRDCLDRSGSSASVIKGAVAKILGAIQSASGNFVGDEVVKSLLVAYTFVHMKIGSYRILMATSELLGDEQTGEICSRMLDDEEAMAYWATEQIDRTALEYLLREAWSEEASRHRETLRSGLPLN